MNYALVFSLIGKLLKVEAAFLLLSLIVSFVYGGSDAAAFILSVVIIAACGFLLGLIKAKDTSYKPKDAFAAAALSWIACSLFGALPFLFSGVYESFADCLFESVSGFTTTGATVIANVEGLPRGILFWRSLSHWIGGMGVLMFIMALLPGMNASAVNLLRAESTGYAPDRVAPKLRDTAKYLYLIYIAMTAVLVGALLLAGLPLYDAVLNAFSTAGTGGFSHMNASVGAHDNIAVDIIITVFMLLFGISFSLFFYLMRKSAKQFFKDEELRLYLLLVFASIAVVTVDIMKLYGSLAESLRYSSFQVASIITTTGFATADYEQWPILSHSVLVLLMVTGSCAGSTAGGIKVSRLLLMAKAARAEVHKLVHPQSVKVIMLNGKKVDKETISRVGSFFFIYCSFAMIAFILVSVNGEDVYSNATAVASMLSNVGPGLGVVGPTGNYGVYSDFSKYVLSFCMIAGRLEFFPLLTLFAPSLWRRRAGG